MKKLILFLISSFFLMQVYSQPLGDTVISNNPAKLKLMVLYFHITNRCNTCKAIEAGVRKTIDSCFIKELATGVVDLYIMNCELPENKDMVTKYEAYGATLAFSSFADGAEQKPEDLTTWAFHTIHSPSDFISGLRQKIIDHLK